MRFHEISCFQGSEVRIDSSDLVAGLAGWLAGWLLAAGWMMRRRGSKVVPHARRSGEVCGFSLIFILS